ncbi:MAG: tetratricopeptide repeat protein, partial [Pseudomonadota bacterium]
MWRRMAVWLLAAPLGLGLAAAQRADAVASCRDALSRDVLTREQIIAARPLCLSDLEAASSAEAYDLLGMIIVGRYRVLEARPLHACLDRFDVRTQLRLNTIRSGRFRDPEVGVSAEDMDGYIAEARRLGDRASLAYLLYKRAHQSYLTDRDRDLITEYTEEALDIAEADGIGYLQRFVLSGMAHMALDDGDYAGAITAYARWGDISLPGDTAKDVIWPDTSIGRVFRDLGAHDEALVRFKRARDLIDRSNFPISDTHDVGLRLDTAKAYQALGQWEEAARTYAAALDVAYGYGGISSDEQALHDGYARVLHALGKTSEAIDQAEAAIAYDETQQQQLQ